MFRRKPRTTRRSTSRSIYCAASIRIRPSRRAAMQPICRTEPALTWGGKQRYILCPSTRGPRGVGMRKRGSNYSLWPEQARPRRAIPLTFGVGGFAIGIVCAVAAHNVVTDFLRPVSIREPVSIQELARESGGRATPINTGATRRGHGCRTRGNRQPHPVLAGGRESHATDRWQPRDHAEPRHRRTRRH